MADLIRIKGGNGDVPTLQDRELAYSRDEEALYIGTDNENVRLCGRSDVVRINDLYTKIEELNAQIEGITARLEALEAPSE